MGRLPGPRAAQDEAPSRLVGRDEELRRVRRLLRSHSLVTLAGPAGAGKSALAAEAAERFDAEVVRVRWWDSAAPTAHGVRAIAQAVLAHHAPVGTDAPDHAERMLLLLDDADPVREECIDMVQRLVAQCPGLRVLVTSRQPLGLGAERVVRLGPLALHAADGRSPGPAVRLFRSRLDRRTATALDPGDAELVVDVCRRTGRTPLALELAARQARGRSLGELSDLLAGGDGWLSDDRRTGPHRHRSLHAAAGATYPLLDRRERVVWARASLFTGDFDEAAATFVCQGPDLPADLVPAALSRLAAATVLDVVDDPGGVVPARYRMPAASRSVGNAVLRAAAEWPAAADRHFTWQCLAADEAADLWRHGHQTLALDQLRAAAPDIAAALARSTAHPGRTADALGLMVDLWFWWGVCGRAAEGYTTVRSLLRAARREEVPVPAGALWLAGWLAARLGRPEAPLLLGDAADAALAGNDLGLLGQISDALAVHAAFCGDRERAVSHLQEAVLLSPERPVYGPPAAVSQAVLACNEARTSPGRARAGLRRALSHPSARDDLWVRCTTGYALAFLDHVQGRKSKAWRRAHRVLADAVALDAPVGIALARGLIHELATGAGPSTLPSPGSLHGPASPGRHASAPPAPHFG
ncbi:ATP-binding protein [Streptomyces sp. NPDC050400]|uniref:ATP-binding protein n=1 Tax=Streptomyces sp. NPDC050400 TaxID=3365610 RepID=UPI0037B97DC2